MTLATYKKNIYKLREINNKICQVENLLAADLFEGPIGELYDMAYDFMIPEGSPDRVYEIFGNLIFNEEISDAAIEKFFNKLFS